MIRLENVLKTYGQDEYIGLDQDVLKTSSEDEDERRLQDVFKMSSSRRMFAGYMIHRDSDLSYDIFNTINVHNQRQKNNLSSTFLTQFNIWKKIIEEFLL